MKIKAYFPIIFALYFPLFGKIIPGIKDLPWGFNKYSFLVMLIAVLSVLHKKTKFKINKELKFFLYFNLLLLLSISIKSILANEIIYGSNIGMGFILSTLIIIYIVKSGIFLNKDFFPKLTKILGIFLFLQIIISVYESYTGHLLGIYAVSNRYTTTLSALLPSRSVLELFNFNIYKVFGLSGPFEGLLGQYNMFGIMLIFYSIYFLAYLEIYKNKEIKYYLILVFFGLIGNGTRSALLVATIIILLYVYNYLVVKKKYSIIILNIFIISIIFLLFLYPLINKIENFYYANDTMTSRIEIWGVIINYIHNLKIPQLLFGVDLDSFIRTFTYSSTESVYLSVLILYGVVGLAYFFIVLTKIFRMKINNNIHNRLITNKLLVLGILLISLVMSGIFFYVNYILITLTFLIFNQKQLLNGLDLKNGTFFKPHLEFK